MNWEINLDRFVSLMSGTRHFKPGVGTPSDDFAIDGRKLPNDALWLLRRMGTASLGHWHFCSFQDSASTRNAMISVRDDVGLDMVDEACVSRQVKPLYWSEFWVPLFVNEHNSICVDLDPAKEGAVGQIIRVSDDSEDRRLICNSLDEFCRLVLEKHELGLLVYRDYGAGPELHEIQDSLEFLWGQDSMQPDKSPSRTPGRHRGANHLLPAGAGQLRC